MAWARSPTTVSEPLSERRDGHLQLHRGEVLDLVDDDVPVGADLVRLGDPCRRGRGAGRAPPWRRRARPRPPASSARRPRRRIAAGGARRPPRASSRPAAASSSRARDPNRSWSSSAGVSTGHIRSRAARTSGCGADRLAQLPRRHGFAPPTRRHRREHLVLDEAPAGVVTAEPAPRRLDDAGRLLDGEAYEAGAERHAQFLTQRALPIAHRLVDHPRHAGVPLDLGGERRVAGIDAGSGPLHVRHEIGEHDLLDAGLAERRQHPLDVAQEDPVRPDHEHTLVLEREAVGVEEVGGTVEGDHGLAGTRPALDDEHPGLRRADDLVLLGLDRGDDVTERAGAAPLERGEQRRVAAERRLRRRRAPRRGRRRGGRRRTARPRDRAPCAPRPRSDAAAGAPSARGRWPGRRARRPAPASRRRPGRTCSSATARRPMWKLSTPSGLSAYRSMRPNTSAASPRSRSARRLTRASSKALRSKRAWKVPPRSASLRSRSRHADSLVRSRHS